MSGQKRIVKRGLVRNFALSEWQPLIVRWKKYYGLEVYLAIHVYERYSYVVIPQGN